MTSWKEAGGAGAVHAQGRGAVDGQAGGDAGLGDQPRPVSIQFKSFLRFLLPRLHGSSFVPQVSCFTASASLAVPHLLCLEAEKMLFYLRAVSF